MDNTAFSFRTATREARRARADGLVFDAIGPEDMPLVNGLLQHTTSRTCDYTAGGLFMWAGLFRYRYCVNDSTLFVTGDSETDPGQTVFMLPCGPMNLERAVAMIERYCHSRRLPAVFSAVPEERLNALLAVCPGAVAEPMDDWADYLYHIEDLALLSGKRFNKKRNHVNRFAQEHPQAVLEPLTHTVITEAMAFLERLEAGENPSDDSPGGTRDYEMDQCMRVLRTWNAWPFEGAVLRTAPGAPIVAMTAAEVIGDTLYTHIEKIDHAVPGAGETVAHLFAHEMMVNHPRLRFCNREEDCGDPGLRRAKESWQPAMLLKKFNVTLNP